MELEDIKQQWETINRKLNEQEIINKKLITNIMKRDMNFISNYNWINVILFIIVIPFVWLMQTKYTPYDWKFIYAALFFLAVYFIWEIYLTLLFDKANRLRNDILTTEKLLIRFKRNRIINYQSSYIVAFFLVLWATRLIWDRMIQTNTWALSTLIFVTLISISIWLTIIYFRKINSINQSISDLKEFEKE